MFNHILQKCWGMFLHPVVRLPADFPLTWSKLGKAYLGGTLLFLLGSLVIPVSLMLLIFLGVSYSSDFALAVGPYIVDEHGQGRVSFMVIMMVLSFAGGFGMEIAYFARCLRKEGKSLRKALALNADSLRSSTSLGTCWAVVWRALVAWACLLAYSFVLEGLLPPGEQDTVDFAKTLVGENLFLFGFMAVVLAPIFEEIVFRGFLFNALRTSLRNAGKWRLGDGWSDFLAVVLSSACFALMHLQFNPTTLLMLFLIGCTCAELYRRSGSLYCPILLHALNNGMVVLILFLTN